MTDQTIRVGFVGAGNNTRRRHIPGFQALPAIELVAVANRTRESGERVAREFGIARVHEDWRDVVRAGDVDAICIGTWPYMHCEVTLAALEHGKHVQLVPAPHTLEVDATLEKLLAEGYVGEVLAVELGAAQGRFVEPEAPLHWRQDAGFSGLNVLNMGIWYEAMMRWLGPARRVTAMTRVAVPRRRDAGGAWHEVRVPDHVDILAQLERGAVAHLRFSSVTALAPPSEVWIFGSDGTLRLEADAQRLWGGRRGDGELREIPVPAERRVGWRVEEEFVNAIRGREKVSRTTFEDGVLYMEFTAAVAQSAATGHAVDVARL